MRKFAGLLSDSVSLDPLTPINGAYEARLSSSQTVPGIFAKEFFARVLSQEALVPIAAYGIKGASYYGVTDGSNRPLGRPLPGARLAVHVRETVAQRLQGACALLRPFGYELFVRDGWRSPITQQAIFTLFMEAYKREHPHASDGDAHIHALTFASDPVFDQADPTTVPLHTTGGAVDVTLSSIGSNAPMDLGTCFDDMSLRAYSAYFEQHAEDEEARELRALLNAAMLSVGFTNYPIEWWHFDFGNRMFAAYCDVLECKAPEDVPVYGYTELLKTIGQK